MALAVWTELIWRKKSGSSSQHFKHHVTLPRSPDHKPTEPKAHRQVNAKRCSVNVSNMSELGEKKEEEGRGSSRQRWQKSHLIFRLVRLNQAKEGTLNYKWQAGWSGVCLTRSLLSDVTQNISFEIWCKSDSVKKHLMTFWRRSEATSTRGLEAFTL